ncbi:sigma-70 family RNA polymerase sigma factor [Microbacterium sp. dk485]|uniref:sigma-70 family RNA polymerase sigma factor n=1 Tax=Microbacterium sp. dk485 TaxID=2560021 RepID=UPI0010749986|nr:sigma-70 family RNA polymerase sigma factor [Microbacterium sp. dk485]TFV82530.1 sigma-70 family RNA polymerase sigma factor [Microbacterium sp. dk485]
MTDPRMLARWHESQRPRLVAIAVNLLGDAAEAEDVVQEAWLRLQRTDPAGIDNLAAWMTTVVSRLSLDVLRSARRRHEAPLSAERWRSHADAAPTPEEDAAAADRVGVALLVVLETLGPAERLAFVLHDVFGLSFPEVAAILDRSEAGSRKLASRARARVRGAAPSRTASRADDRLVAAWLRAAREGEFATLLELLDEGAVLRADYGTHSETIRGARDIAGRAALSAALAARSTRILVNGRPAVAAVVRGRVVSVMIFGIHHGRITALEVLAGAERLRTIAGLDEAVGLA